MKHCLNFGAGPNQLPPPWQNLNAEHDIRKPLRFESESTSRILAEHVIEHVPFLSGYSFLLECRRILVPGGVLRLAFPDVGRMVAMGVDQQERTHYFVLGKVAEAFSEVLAEHPDAGELLRAEGSPERCAVRSLLVGWHHESAWTEFSAAAVLLTVGFSRVLGRKYGVGELGEFDGHHKAVGEEFAKLTTTVLEAYK